MNAGCGSRELRRSVERPIVRVQRLAEAATSRMYFSLKPVIRPASSVTRMPSVVDSSVAPHHRQRVRQLARLALRSASLVADQLLLRRAGAPRGCSARSAARRSAAAVFLVVVVPSTPPPSTSRRERGAEHARADLRERRVAASSTCRRRTARTRSRRSCRVARAGCTRAASRTRSRTSSGVSMRGSIGAIDADEDALIRLQVLADDLQDARAVPLAGQRDVEIADLQLEQAGQQLGVVDVGAVRRVAVAAGAGVHADALRAPRRRSAPAPGCSGR